MHEVGVALEIHRTCRAQLAAHGPTRLERVKVAVGELSAVEPEILRHAWEMVVADGPDAEATLEIEWRPARQTCPDCGEIAERQDGDWLRLCPRCELPLAIEGGRELELLQFAFIPLIDVPEVGGPGADGSTELDGSLDLDGALDLDGSLDPDGPPDVPAESES